MSGYERDMQELTIEQAVARNKIIAKYEADCARLREDPSLIDRLEAEIAQLREEIPELRETVTVLHEHIKVLDRKRFSNAFYAKRYLAERGEARRELADTKARLYEQQHSKNLVLGQCGECEESRMETIQALSEVCELRDELHKEQSRGEALYRQYEQVEAMFHNQRRINSRQNYDVTLALIEKLKEPRYSDTGAPEGPL